MSQQLTINVKNHEPQTQSFYFFQQPAIYTGGGQVYSNSLYSQSLGNYDATGAILTLQVELQYYAGIQQAVSSPQVGQSSGYTSASRAIDPAPAGAGSSNHPTTASILPLGLSVPTSSPGVEPEAFRITTPTYASPAMYNVGSALAVNGGIVLSNFVQTNPMNNVDSQPILKYYVQTGTYMPGAVMNFAQSSVNAALADFTGGYTLCNVTLNADGTWSTQMQ